MKSVQPNKSPRERRLALLEEKRASSCTVDSIVGCLTEILREAHRCPDDSLVDIANDAFLSHGVPMLAEWTDDDSDPIKVTPNAALKSADEGGVS
jgi:hypothetical protein